LIWQDLGACAKGRADGIDFFPHPKAGRHAADPAKALCRICFVRGQCLDEALHYDECGIWGGTTESERKVIKDRYVRVKGRKPLARTIASL
jgi:WhiB family transcriptional regulator, redox-sensing transcriptional regulator